MTSPLKLIGSKVKLKDESCDLCKEIKFCAFGNGLDIGICECPESDHYGHIISEMHPTCDRIDLKENYTKDYIKEGEIIEEEIDECLEKIEELLFEYRCHIEPYDIENKNGIYDHSIPVLVDDKTRETRTFLSDRD